MHLDAVKGMAKKCRRAAGAYRRENLDGKLGHSAIAREDIAAATVGAQRASAVGAGDRHRRPAEAQPGGREAGTEELI